MVNATGWSELMSADLVGASYAMYNAAFADWTVIILFIVFQFMLLIKTKSPLLALVTGTIFAALYGTSAIVKPISVPIIFVILGLELAGILYFLVWKD